MVNVAFTVFSLVVLVVAVATRGQVSTPDTSEVLSVKSETSTPSATPAETESPTPHPTPLESLLFATSSASPQPTSSTSASLKPAATGITEWMYVPSIVTAQTENELVLSTTQPVNLVTTWYRETLGKLGFVATNVIQTQQAQGVYNKLSGTRGRSKVTIEISQENSTVPVTVLVKVTGSNSSV